ncbi:MAG: DegT/DnrJ/EryC1/StrS family aminotransferase [Omnitrophica bacterium]|nr:DegT/DnrJ/EryC1/StrS family aminotransferase [Candidatus Omnitrophota bacterium]
MKPINIIDLGEEYTFIKKDIERELAGCLKSQSWILGKKVSEFEAKAARYLSAKYTIGVASGTDALVLSLRALAITLRKKGYFDKKDEIITTPFTFVATAEAIVRSGATPVFVDINSDTFNICPQKLKKAITKNTVGILPVHLFGLACCMDKISEIAKKHDLFVVEDAAQAFGCSYQGKKIGSFGDLSAFSFFPSKNLGSFGDAGLVATSNSRLAELVRVLRNHGQSKKYKADYIGYNSRLDSIQAAILIVKLKHIDKFNQLRRKVAKEYDRLFRSIKQVQAPRAYSELNHIYNLYTIKVFSKRDELSKYLNSQGIASRIYYPVPLYEMKAFKGIKAKGDFKAVREILPKVLSLPMHPFLRDSQIKYIARNVHSFFSK